MRIFRHLLVALLILLSLLIFSSILLIYTQTGTKLLFDLAQRVVPQLTVKKVSGNLTHLTLQGVNYQQTGISVNVAELTLNNELSSLLQGKLKIKQLGLDQVQVKVDTSLLPNTPAKSSNTNAQITLPLSLDIEQLQLSKVTVIVNNMSINIAHFDTQIGWSGSTLSLIKPTLNRTSLHFAPTPISKQKVKQVETQSISAVSLQQQITNYMQQIQQQLKQPIVLPNVLLPLNIQITQFEALNTQIVGQTSLNIKQLGFSLNAIESNITLSAFSLNSTLGTLSLNANIGLTAGWSIQLTGKGQLYQPTEQQFVINAAGNIYNGLQLTVKSTGPFNAQLSVKLALHNPQAPLLLDLETSGLNWPLTGTPKITLEKSHISLKGTLEHYTVSANMAVKLAPLPDVKIQLLGKGDATQFDLSKLNITFKNAGQIALTAKLDWQNAIKMNATIQAQHLNLQHIIPTLNSQLSGGLQLQLMALQNSWEIAVDKIAITGELNGKNLKFSGALSGSSNHGWDFNPILVELGVNKVTLKGNYQHNSDLDLNINAPDLSHILPNLQGSIIGHLSFKGTLSYPQVLSQLRVTNFTWQDLSIEQLELKSNIAGSKQLQGQLSLAIQQLNYAEQVKINRIALDVSGTETQHKINLTVDGQPVGANLQILGNFNRQKMLWQLDFKQAVLQLTPGNWALQQPMQLNYDFNTHQLTLSKQAWMSKVGRIMLPHGATITPEQGNLAVQLTQLQLNMLNPLLKAQNIALSGEVSAQGDISWSSLNQQLQPKIEFGLNTDHITIKDLITEQVIPIVNEMDLKLLLNSQQAKIDLGIKLPQQGVVKGNLLINDPLKQRTINGILSIQSLDLNQFKSLLQHSDKLSGKIAGQLKLSGSLQSPEIFGGLSVNQLILQDKKLPLQLLNGEIKLNFAGKKSTLNSHFKFEKGQLTLNGSSNWSEKSKPEAQLSAVGENIQIKVPLYGEVTLSPNIQVKAIPQNIRVKGAVNIPEANITIKSLPSSVVDISDDQVLVDSNLQPITEKKKAISLDGQVDINIGPNVLFSGFGLTTGLTGTTVLLLNAGNPELHGNIFLNNGKYQAYGQNLVIRKGQLTFSGPISATTLNVEAIRNPDAIRNNVTAGIKVTGSIKHPRVSLFSRPSLPQQQILSYLLRGQSLDSGDNSSLATTLLLSLGSSTGTNILKKLASPLGIKDLSIDSKGSGQQSQVVVSGYILPKLKVEYGVGLFDSLATLTVRYQLLSQLYVEAKSGLNQAIELLYQFSFN